MFAIHTTDRMSRAAVVAIALVCVPLPVVAQVSTWQNSNVSGTPPTTLDWFLGGPTPQAAWGGGEPVSSGTSVVQFFANTTTPLPNTSTTPSTQVANLNNGGTAFELGTLRFSGRGSTTSNANLQITLSGDPLNFSGLAGSISLDAMNGVSDLSFDLARASSSAR